MSEVYRTVYRGGEGELEEKKSRFIAHVSPVVSVDEAMAFIAGIKKKYWDARHNCSAFVIGPDAGISRSSDDGEPAGTAGKPMLEVLTGERLTDVCVVVTRYFGGIKLGTGGLIRAYTGAVKEGLKACALIEKHKGMMLTVSVDFTLEGRIRRLFSERGIPVMSCVYSEGVQLDTVVDLSAAGDFAEWIVSNTDGRAEVLEVDEVIYAVADGEVLLF